MDTQSFYQLIAQSNPKGAKEVIREFGYKSTNGNLAANLRELVANEGEDALQAIAELHPHKDIILDVFGGTKEQYKNACGCAKCKAKESWNNADGESNKRSTDLSQLTMQTNAMIFAGVFIMAVAIIVTKK